MSIQLGKCNLDGKPVNPHELEEFRPVLAPYGPDGEGYICRDNFGILYRSFHTSREARRETQPHVSKSGAVITWDGRLDNRKALIERLGGELSADSTDLEIVAAGYDRWGTDTFPELIGDWALSIWRSDDQSLVLAKDFIGTRHLYYALEGHYVTWCTILDPLLLFRRHPFKLEEEYVAGWISFFPAAHLTPYEGVHAVPPSSFVRIRRGIRQVTKYWDFDPAKRIRYRTDSEYEEHFRTAFSEAVHRRLRSDSPILAELSGGMDSSSIVCVADEIIGNKFFDGVRLDTVSYYDDTEPNWNERPYFTKVEEKRGRTGCHIDVASQEIPFFDPETDHFAATPTSTAGLSEAAKQLALCVTSQGNRVLLSGIGGDEVAGGVPTPIPELADLLAEVRLSSFAHQLKTWSLAKRKPWLHLFTDVVLAFLPPSFAGSRRHVEPTPWLAPHFARRNKSALRGYPTRLRLFGGPPSFQENLSTLELLRRQLACSALTDKPLYQTAYPYLDRDFLTFLYSIPREQIVRPGQRRSLMRRALREIVPDDILNRRRKAFLSRPPLTGLSNEGMEVSPGVGEMRCASLGITCEKEFSMALQRARRGQDASSAVLIRALRLEFWLRHLERHRIRGNRAVVGLPDSSIGSRNCAKSSWSVAS